MQIEALKIFCDVARLRSFSEAAEANQVMQSSTSQTVHQLERHLGVALIDRSHRPWDLTKQGQVFYEGCRGLLDEYHRLETKVRRIQDDVSSVVNISAIYSVGLRHMQEYIDQFSESHPTVTVRVEYLHPDQVYRSVLHDMADLGIVSFPQLKTGLKVIPWREEQMVLVCHPSHRFADQKEISLSQLEGEKFVGFARGLGIRKQIDKFLKQNKVKVRIGLEFDNIEAIKRAIEVGSGISILPKPTLDHEIALEELVAIPFSNKKFTRPLGIIYRRGKKFYPNAIRFFELLRKGTNGTSNKERRSR